MFLIKKECLFSKALFILLKHWIGNKAYLKLSLREKCPDTEFFLARIQENTDLKKLRIWALFAQRFSVIPQIMPSNNSLITIFIYFVYFSYYTQAAHVYELKCCIFRFLHYWFCCVFCYPFLLLIIGKDIYALKNSAIDQEFQIKPKK